MHMISSMSSFTDGGEGGLLVIGAIVVALIIIVVEMLPVKEKR